MKGLVPFSFWKVKSAASLSNYYGNSFDGALVISTNTNWTPPNIYSAYDGDMIYKQCTSFTINSGITVQPTQPCRGIFIYSQTDIVINGTLTMSGFGPFVNPVATATASFTGTITGTSTSVTISAVNAGTMGNVISLTFSGSNSIINAITTWNSANPLNQCVLTTGVGTQIPSAGSRLLNTVAGAGANVTSDGLVIRRLCKVPLSAGSDSVANRFVGAGLGIGAAENFQPVVVNGFVYKIPLIGGVGGTPGSVNGGVSTNGSGGGGCGGPFNASGGAGAAGTCFTGGSGGGGSNTTGTVGNPGQAYGGPGGEGVGGTGGGGPGNPNPPTPDTIGKGLGGLIILCAKRDIIIGSAGVVSTAGTFGGDSSFGGGGGSGAAPFVGMYGRFFNNAGSITSAGGANGVGNSTAGKGGSGAQIIQQIS